MKILKTGYFNQNVFETTTDFSCSQGEAVSKSEIDKIFRLKYKTRTKVYLLRFKVSTTKEWKTGWFLDKDGKDFVVVNSSWAKKIITIGKLLTAKEKEAKELRDYNRKLLNSFKKHYKEEIKRRKNDGLCCAVLFHGPGHQSKTFCECKGDHKIHQTRYGCYEEFMQWRGSLAFTDYNDEPKDLK